MAYTLGNKCAKNLCKQIVLLKLIIENVVTCFFWNTVYMDLCSRLAMACPSHWIITNLCVCVWMQGGAPAAIRSRSTVRRERRR